jgi:CRISPR-associated protein Cmr2
MKYIFQFTIAPVQSFIAQARKTQDLYAGSLILSELTRKAVRLAKEKGIKLVFPKTFFSTASFPNRFIGTIEGDWSEIQLQEIGQYIENELIGCFGVFAKRSLQAVGFYGMPLSNGFWEQINQHLDINWLFHPIENGYARAYKEAESLMAALKNVRLVTNKHAEAGRKCSLDGERNALFFGKGSNPNYIRFNQGNVVSTGAWLNKNEGLSAVSLMKRTYQAEITKKFPSTAAITLSNTLNTLSIEQRMMYVSYKSLFGDTFDEQLCYEDNLNEKYLEQNGYQAILNKCTLAQLQTWRTNALPNVLPKYYAILAFDGDKMGKLLSGETRKDSNSDLAAFQTNVSSTLIPFGKWIYDELEQKEAKLHVIYTGGDDFLGFVSLNNLFEVVKRLRTEFDKQVNAPLKEAIHGDFTFSMGIAIAHYKEPLSIVLRTAREMEALAKNKGDRDAFAIAAIKHSGENHQAYFNWDLNQNGDIKLPNWNALKQLVHHFQKDCSETFVRSLDRTFYNLQDSEGTIENSFEASLQTELLRLAAKSLNKDAENDAQTIQKTVWQLFKTNESGKILARNALEATKIALFLKRELKK